MNADVVGRETIVVPLTIQIELNKYVGVEHCFRSLQLEGPPVIEFPFRLASPEIPLILFPARANGVAFDAVLDTGNVSFHVSPRCGSTQRLGLTPTDDPELPLVRLERLELGEHLFEDVEAGVFAQLDDIADRGGFSSDGNLGFHFVKDRRLEIDYPNERIRFVSSSSPMPDPGIPFESGVHDMAIVFPAEVNGRGPYCFLLDTGASSSVVSPRLARELELSGPSLEGMAVSVLGNLQAQPVQLDSLATLGRDKQPRRRSDRHLRLHRKGRRGAGGRYCGLQLPQGFRGLDRLPGETSRAELKECQWRILV